MAVVGVAREQGGGRTQDYDGGTWTAERVWFVHTDNKNDRENTVSGASGLPYYGEAHPGPISAAMYCKTIGYKTVSNVAEKIWVVTAGYTSERALHSTDAEQDEVLTSYTSEIYQEDFFRDEDDNAVCNSAGEPFLDPAPVRDAAQGIWKVRSNHTAIPPFILSYRNATNSAAFTIGGLSVAKKTAKIMRIEVGERQLRGNNIFYPLQMEIHVHDKGWRFKPLDQGLKERDADNKLVHIRNAGDTQNVTTAAMLDGAGKALTDPTPTNAVFGDFQQYKEKTFSGLPGIS
jgi:hypothetical protein